MDIPNPRRILVIGHPDCGVMDLLTVLTGSSPTADNHSSLAGLSHALQLNTAYYSATVPIWLDEISLHAPPAGSESADSKAASPDADAGGGGQDSPAAAWASEFLRPEAKEVLDVLGAFVLCFRKPSSASEQAGVRRLIEEVSRVVRDGLNGGSTYGGWDGVCVAVGMKRAVLGWVRDGEAEGGEKEMGAEEWEDICSEFGFEYVDGEDRGRGKNEYGELTGISRLREALEANDWASNDDDTPVTDSFGEDAGFGAEAAELEKEMLGMRRAIYGRGDNEEDNRDEARDESEKENEEDEVEKLEAVMLRMQAVREMGAGMPEEERKKLAARAVKEMLRSL